MIYSIFIKYFQIKYTYLVNFTYYKNEKYINNIYMFKKI